MNKTLIVAAISALAASSALAQSSVTVFGRLNTSAEYQKNIAVADKQSVLQNDASRLGFKGTEDLGGGLKANFYLEHRFNSDTGATTNPSAFWAGDSWVGISGGFGAVRMGRLTSAAYYATADYVSMHNHDTGTSEDKLYSYLSQNANTISYTTPTFGGFNLEVTQSAAEGPVKTNKVTNVAGNYDAGPLHLGLGYERQDGSKDNQFGLRALYEAGPFTFGGYYQRTDASKVYATRTAPLGKRDAFRLSAMYTLGASEFHLNAGVADDWSKLNNSKAQQYTVAYNYNLSKRTKVYVFYTKVDNGSAYSYFGYVSPTGVVYDPSSLALGIRHNF